VKHVTPTDTRMTGDEIRQARKQLGLTQAQFARVMGFRSRPYVSDVEADRYTLSDTAQRLLTAYLSGYRPGDWPDGK